MLREEHVNIHGGDGVVPAFLVMPGNARKGPVGAILLVQEAFGVNQWMRETARKFAHEGYLVLAPEFFHRQGSGLEFSYEDTDKFMPALQQLTGEGMTHDFAASFEFLRERFSVETNEVAVIGYCVGGYGAMLAAARFPIATGIAYYGGGMVNERPGFGLKPILGEFGTIGSPVLLFFGAEDKGIGPEQHKAIGDALRKGNKQFTLQVMEGAGHGFANDDRPGHYNEKAAKGAWKQTLDWLKNVKSSKLRAAG